MIDVFSMLCTFMTSFSFCQSSQTIVHEVIIPSYRILPIEESQGSSVMSQQIQHEIEDSDERRQVEYNLDRYTALLFGPSAVSHPITPNVSEPMLQRQGGAKSIKNVPDDLFACSILGYFSFKEIVRLRLINKDFAGIANMALKGMKSPMPLENIQSLFPSDLLKNFIKHKPETYPLDTSLTEWQRILFKFDIFTLKQKLAQNLKTESQLLETAFAFPEDFRQHHRIRNLKQIAVNHYLNLRPSFSFPLTTDILSYEALYQRYNLDYKDSLVIVSFRDLLRQQQELDSLFQENPDKCLVIETATKSLHFSHSMLPAHVKALAFLGPQVERIEEGFLSRHQELTHIDLSLLKGVKTIGDMFLYNCLNLKSTELPLLHECTEIGTHFLCACNSLQFLDLSSFDKVRSIGSCFLAASYNLTYIDLLSLKQVQSIEDNFLYGCWGITSLDLSSLKQVESIGNNFLSCCYKLRSVNLSIFENVKSIGYHFLSHCRELPSVDLSAFYRVTVIQDDFLSSCWGITSLDLSSLKQVESIGNNFLSCCYKLRSVNLSIFENVTSIGDRFLNNCRELPSVDLSAFSGITVIKDDFLYGCSGLTFLELNDLKYITVIGMHFLSYCKRLTNLEVPLIWDLRIISSGFLYQCKGLISVDLRSLRMVERIESDFLSGCIGLRSLDLRSLGNVVSIGPRFLKNCTNLCRIEIVKSQKNSILHEKIAKIFETRTRKIKG